MEHSQIHYLSMYKIKVVLFVVSMYTLNLNNAHILSAANFSSKTSGTFRWAKCALQQIPKLIQSTLWPRSLWEDNNNKKIRTKYIENIYMMYTVNSRCIRATKMSHFVAKIATRWSIHNAIWNTISMYSTSLRPAFEMVTVVTPKA